jgi:hypothetical protein
MPQAPQSSCARPYRSFHLHSLGARLQYDDRCECRVPPALRGSSSERHDSVDPVATSTIVRVWMNEPATDVPPCTPMSTSQKARSFQPLNVRNRHLTTDRGVKARQSATATRCRHLHVAEHSIDRCGARKQLPTLAFAELQSAKLLQCWQKDRNHRHEPLAAHAIPRFPQCCERVFDVVP